MSKADNKPDTDEDGSWGFVEGLSIETESHEQEPDLDALRDEYGSLQAAWGELLTDLRIARHNALQNDQGRAFEQARSAVAQLEEIIEAEPDLREGAE